ncbi:MAG: peptidase M15 [Synergistaceae bacterium]|jgi:uncharacterized protein YcbK (DUF882 family)|nr:peptidase M15 [Synergistaceae bacterium]
MINDFRLSPHFKLYEFQCRCCGTVKLSAVLTEMLEDLRGQWRAPLVITSGFRCAPHNRAVGGASHSRHLRGEAADIFARPAAQRMLKKMAERLGFSEVICGGPKNYIHVAIEEGEAA